MTCTTPAAFSPELAVAIPALLALIHPRAPMLGLMKAWEMEEVYVAIVGNRDPVCEAQLFCSS